MAGKKIGAQESGIETGNPRKIGKKEEVTSTSAVEIERREREASAGGGKYSAANRLKMGS